ncbi:MAG TPA: S53 family peptidase [Acidimicrobiales bacterium]
MGLVRRTCACGASLSLLGVVWAMGGASGSQAGAAQATIPGTAATLVQGATDLGPAADQPLSVTLTLPLRNQAGLTSLIAGLTNPSSPTYHQFETPAQFTSQFGPTTGTVNAVTSWAAGAGLTVTSVSPNRTLVSLSGTLSQLGQAFGVTFHSFRMTNGQSYISNGQTATLPAALAGDVSSVVGLSTLGKVAVGPTAAATGSLSFPSSYGPQDFWTFYNAPAGQTGAGQTIAVLAEGDLSSPRADLVTFEQKYGLPTVPWTTVPTGAASTDTSGNDEWDLDTQYSTGLAQDVSSLLVYDAPSLSDTDILAEMNKWVTDDQAKQANFSAGECEVLADASGFLTSNDQVLEQGVAQGQTLFTASGDTGSFCPLLVGVNGVPAGLPGVNYPAASPYAVGVGGTTILGATSPLSEIGWYAGGGGMSLLESEPAYQSAVGGSNLGVRRGVPDVSFDADPNSGFNVIVGGQNTVVGGTSGSSPSWLGIWARTQAAHGGNLGFANATIYAEPATAFNDVVLGTNVLYPVTPGYDYVTGRGTPNIAAFISGA